MTACSLGIDTSCYTTSAALAGDGRILSSSRRLLIVKEGERGLRQSEAVFQHVRALPEIIKEVMAGAPDDAEIELVCASSRPRDEIDSYMPVFVAGASYADAIACALRARSAHTSHQQGHIRAALNMSGLTDNEFVALHLSGGTTQTLLATRDLRIKPICGTNDLNAGQFVDRVGVKLGLGFPCGPKLEELALSGEAKGRFTVRLKAGECSFSGVEAHATRLIESREVSPEDVAAEVYLCLARTVARLIADAIAVTKARSALLAGGVASSALLRRLLPAQLDKLNCAAALYWAQPDMSGDNACGVALIGEDIRKGNTISGLYN